MTNPLKNSLLSSLEGASDLSSVLRNLSYIDLRFSDPFGNFHSKQILSSKFEQIFESNSIFLDGSSIPGWASISTSDLRLEPDLDTFRINPFSEYPSGSIIANAVNPDSNIKFDCDPRTIASNSIDYLKETGIGDTCWIGPEPEFFIFDSMTHNVGDPSASSHNISSDMFHSSPVKNFYFTGSPHDIDQSLRTEIMLMLDAIGIGVDSMHSEVGTGQHEIQLQHQNLVDMADAVMFFKEVVKNVSDQAGKVATFMPKPLYKVNGSGMHVNLSITKDSKNIFANDDIELSDSARYFIGGIFKNAHALSAFTNPAINSYKRLVAGYEAPTTLVYGNNNRSAALRIPPAPTEKSLRLEYRVPDPASNPYLCFSSILMAGIDGIQNSIDPGDMIDFNLYNYKDASKYPATPTSLEMALNSLETDYQFLKPVFSELFLEQYISHKRDTDLDLLRQLPAPSDFQLYFDC